MDIDYLCEVLGLPEDEVMDLLQENDMEFLLEDVEDDEWYM